MVVYILYEWRAHRLLASHRKWALGFFFLFIIIHYPSTDSANFPNKAGDLYAY